MNNLEIASIFRDISVLLQISGANPFRIRAYETAVGVIEELTRELPDIVAELEEGGAPLTSIPGIGKAVAEKIVEIVETGSCKARNDLLEELPRGLLDIVSVPGIGPKKAALFYKELEIGDLDSLEKAALAGRLAELPRMGIKSEEKIAKAISDYRSLSRVFGIGYVSEVALDIVNYLRKVEGLHRAVPAGSLRRFKDSPGDLDILVICAPGSSVMQAFIDYHAVDSVVGSGETKTSVILKGGLQVDLRVVADSEFGSALHHFTGSKAHNVAMRERAARRGLKISEYGVFDREDNNTVEDDSEEAVYKAVGLPCIVPELRENLGEIEAAEAGNLPELVNLSDIRGDLHMHTTASDGSNSIEDMARAAIGRDYEYIAITEHSRSTFVANGLDESRLLKHIEAIDEVNKKLASEGLNFRILKGIECDILADGRLDLSAEVLKKLDIVVGAVHSGFSESREVMTARIIKALSTGLVDILAHPTGRLIGRRAAFELDMEAVMQTAKEYGVIMELNSYPDRLDLKDTHLRLAKQTGLLVSINTDAHNILGLGNIYFGLHTARRAWLEKGHVLNTRSLDELLDILKKRRK